MIEGRLSALAALLEGRLQGTEATFTGVSTDTRTLAPGALFVALRGERYDAHELLEAARLAGAAGAVVERPAALALPQIVVTDTRRSLGVIARDWRRRHTLPLVAITGSNGKTTTKELTASVLRQAGPTLATEGNLNNDIGVPQTLFRLAAEHRYAVIEMGANRPDDISDLVAIAEPTHALVTMCAPAHLEGFGSLAGVARAKGQIYSRLGASGTALFNVDDPHHIDWRAVAGPAHSLTFGLAPGAAVSARDITLGALGAGSRFTLVTPLGELLLQLPLDGLHNVRNALAAATVGVALGLSLTQIRAGLESVSAVRGRLVVKRVPGGMRLIDDSYNANPASLAAALDVLSREPAPRWVVLGDMGELGGDAAAAHREAGQAARAAGVSRLLTVGPLAALAAESFGAGAVACADRAEALRLLREEGGAEITLLVKGSRYMQLDRLVGALLEPEGQPVC